MAQKNFQPFFIERSEYSLSLKAKGSELYGVATQANESDFEYLLTLNYGSHGHELYLPPTYKLVVSVYLSLCAKEKRDFESIHVPNIELDLSYSDIGNSKHGSRHKLKGEIIRMVIPPKEKNELDCPEFTIRYVEIS